MRYLLTILLIFGLLVSCSDDDDSGSTNPTTNEIKIGALLSITGGGSSIGESSQSALKIAEEDANNWLEEQNANFRIKLIIEDTESNPETALSKLQSFNNQGIKFVVGPETSSEAEYIVDFADQNDIILLSPSSVAISLAKEGDNLWRMSPSDKIQAKAMAKMMEHDGITNLMALVRDDVWGTDLYAELLDYTMDFSTVDKFIFYKTNSLEFSEDLQGIEEMTEQLMQSGIPGNQIAVYLLSFAEGSIILDDAGSYNMLANVKWYGSSAVADNAVILKNAEASEFASTVGFPCPVYRPGGDDNSKALRQQIEQKIIAEIGRTPEVYAFCAYDALMLAAYCYQAVETDHTIADLIDQLKSQPSNHTLTTGSVGFDSAGDRAWGDYNFWSIEKQSDSYQWINSYVYDYQNDQILAQ